MTSKYLVFMILAIIIIAGPASLFATIREVPGTYATIQAGIDAASNGDTVNVAAGSYSGAGNEDINTLGKAILVKGVPDSTSCGRFIINTGEDTTTIIRGFGGIAGTNINSSSPIIECCTFGGGPVWQGGAILIDGGDPIVRKCSFIQSKANRGGAIFCSGGSLTLYQNNFWYCIAIDTFDYKFSYEGKGGAIYASDEELTISQCSFHLNTAIASDDNQGGKGGAIYLNSNSSAVVDSSVFSNNYVSNYGTNPFGGAVYNVGNSTAEFTNVTFMQNYASWGSAYYQDAGCMASFTNCLVWENTNGPNIYSCEPSSEIYITCCNFSPLTWLNGCISDWQDTLDNMSVDPQYCSVNFSHDPNSPCLPDNNNCGVRIGAIGETGDANLDNNVNLLDVLYLISYVYEYNPFDMPPMSVLHYSKNVDCENAVNLLDIMCLMNHLYYDSCDLCDCD